MNWSLATILLISLAHSATSNEPKIRTEEVEDEFRNDGKMFDSLPFDDELRHVASGNDDFDTASVTKSKSDFSNSPYENEIDKEGELADEDILEALANYGAEIESSDGSYYTEDDILETLGIVPGSDAFNYDDYYAEFYETTTKKKTTPTTTVSSTTTTLVESKASSTTTTTVSTPIATQTDSSTTTPTIPLTTKTTTKSPASTSTSTTTASTTTEEEGEKEFVVIPDLVDLETTSTSSTKISTSSVATETTTTSTTGAVVTETTTMTESTTIMPPVIVVSPKFTSTTTKKQTVTATATGDVVTTESATIPVTHKQIYFDVSIENETPEVVEEPEVTVSTSMSPKTAMPIDKETEQPTEKSTTHSTIETQPRVVDKEQKTSPKVIPTKTQITKGSDTYELEVTGNLDINDEEASKSRDDNAVTPVIAGSGMSIPVIIAIAIAIFLFIIIIIIFCAIRNQKNRRGKYIFKKGQTPGGNRDDEEALENGHNESTEPEPKKYEAEV